MKAFALTLYPDVFADTVRKTVAVSFGTDHVFAKQKKALLLTIQSFKPGGLLFELSQKGVSVIENVCVFW